MKYSGIDLHSNNSLVTVMDEEDRVVAEKRLPNAKAMQRGQARNAKGPGSN